VPNDYISKTYLEISQKLVGTVWSLWETGGNTAISARSLARQSGIPISTIYNHFASLDDVLYLAQERALAEARLWCDSQMEQLSPAVEQPESISVPTAAPTASGLDAIMAAIIDEWVRGQRHLCFAWREGLLLARREPRYLPIWRGWRDLWAEFWHAVCSRFGLGEFGEWTSFIFESEATLHMLSWRRVLDRACLDELCTGWVTWLSGQRAPDGPWRSLARQIALASSPAPAVYDEMTQRVALAAAEVVERRGVANLTHRSVAASAGVSLGVVSSRFRTSADLLHAAFEMIYSALSGQRSIAIAASQEAAGTSERTDTVQAATLVRQAHRWAVDELMLATAREPSFQSMAPQMRYLRGRSARNLLGAKAQMSWLDAALLSGFTAGMQRATIDFSAHEQGNIGRAHMARLTQLLGLPGSSSDGFVL